jgi:hypothetical protein
MLSPTPDFITEPTCVYVSVIESGNNPPLVSFGAIPFGVPAETCVADGYECVRRARDAERNPGELLTGDPRRRCLMFTGSASTTASVGLSGPTRKWIELGMTQRTSGGSRIFGLAAA